MDAAFAHAAAVPKKCSIYEDFDELVSFFNLDSKAGSGSLEQVVAVSAKDWKTAFANVPEKLAVMNLEATPILRQYLFDPKNAFVTEFRPYVFKDDLSSSMWKTISEQRNDIVKAYLSLFGRKAPKTAEDTALFNLILKKLRAGKTDNQIKGEIIDDYVRSIGRQVGKDMGLVGDKLKVLETHAVQHYGSLAKQSDSLDVSRAPEVLKALIAKAASIKASRA